jgi:hypothetical protein
MVSMYVSPKWLAWCVWWLNFLFKMADLTWSKKRVKKAQNKVSEEISEEINVT